MTTPTDLTRDHIVALEAGNELNALVAERVMGWTRRTWQGVDAWEWPGMVCWRRVITWKLHDGPFPDLPKTADQLPPYSTDLATAWQAAEHLISQGFGVMVENWSPQGSWSVVITYPSGHSGGGIVASTLPLAICRAVLLMSLESPSTLFPVPYIP